MECKISDLPLAHVIVNVHESRLLFILKTYVTITEDPAGTITPGAWVLKNNSVSSIGLGSSQDARQSWSESKGFKFNTSYSGQLNFGGKFESESIISEDVIRSM